MTAPGTPHRFDDEVAASAQARHVPAPTAARCELATGITVEYVEQGVPSGQPVVLLHGLTDSWRSFEPLLPHLPNSLRVFALSLRGHGGSDRPDAGYAMRDMAADVVAFMDAMRLDTAVIVGHSMGARVALRVAVDHPRRARALVLLAAFAPGLANPVHDELEAAVAALTEEDVPAFARDFQQGTIARPVAAGFVETMIGESMRLPPQTWRAVLDGFLADDASPQLGDLHVPILLVWGTKDDAALRGDQEALCAACPEARLEVHVGAGHAVHWEDPARVAADVLSFIAAMPPHTTAT